MQAYRRPRHAAERFEQSVIDRQIECVVVFLVCFPLGALVGIHEAITYEHCPKWWDGPYVLPLLKAANYTRPTRTAPGRNRGLLSWIWCARHRP